MKEEGNQVEREHAHIIIIDTDPLVKFGGGIVVSDEHGQLVRRFHFVHSLERILREGVVAIIGFAVDHRVTAPKHRDILAR